MGLAGVHIEPWHTGTYKQAINNHVHPSNGKLTLWTNLCGFHIRIDSSSVTLTHTCQNLCVDRLEMGMQTHAHTATEGVEPSYRQFNLANFILFNPVKVCVFLCKSSIECMSVSTAWNDLFYDY